MSMNDVLEQLRTAAKASGLQGQVVAKRAGIAGSAVSRFLSGKRSLSVPALFALARALGYDVVLKRRGRTQKARH